MPLEDSRRKMERAWHHLEAVREATTFEARDEEVPVFLDPETREYVIRFQIPPIHPMVPLMIGDFAHNARSALDCAVVELGRHHRQAAADMGQFPIFFDEEEFVSRGTRMIATLPTEARAYVESVQPYRGWEKAHVLGDLAGLSNTDKHRNIPVVLPQTGSLRLVMREGSNSDLGNAYWESPRDGWLGARVPLLSDAEPKFDAAIGGFIAFANTDGVSRGMPVGTSIYVTLVEIQNVVEKQVLPRLEAFF